MKAAPHRQLWPQRQLDPPQPAFGSALGRRPAQGAHSCGSGPVGELFLPAAPLASARPGVLDSRRSISTWGCFPFRFRGFITYLPGTQTWSLTVGAFLISSLRAPRKAALDCGSTSAAVPARLPLPQAPALSLTTLKDRSDRSLHVSIVTSTHHLNSIRFNIGPVATQTL